MRASRVQSVGRLLWKGKQPQCNLANLPKMVKREPTMIAVESINLQRPKEGIKKSGAWRYAGNIIQRAPSTKLGSGTYTDDRDPGEARRKHESNFFITLNTNKTLNGMDPMIAQHGREACRDALGELSRNEALCSYIKFGPKSAHYRSDVFDDVITKVEWQAAVETGENLGRLHCHIWLTLHHYSQVQVNMPVMQRMFKEAYNRRTVPFEAKLTCKGRPYIQVKLLPTSDWAEVMKRYIYKAMTDHKENSGESC